MQRTAAIALAVGADDEEWPLNRGEGRTAGQERAGEVDAADVVLVLDLEPEEPLPPRHGRADVYGAASLQAALRPLDEEKARTLERLELRAQMLLELRREQASSEHVARPGAAVLDEDPVVDAAGGRRERLVARARDRRAERATRELGTWLGRHDSHEPTVADL